MGHPPASLCPLDDQQATILEWYPATKNPGAPLIRSVRVSGSTLFGSAIRPIDSHRFSPIQIRRSCGGSEIWFDSFASAEGAGLSSVVPDGALAWREQHSFASDGGATIVRDPTQSKRRIEWGTRRPSLCDPTQSKGRIDGTRRPSFVIPLNPKEGLNGYPAAIVRGPTQSKGRIEWGTRRPSFVIPLNPKEGLNGAPGGHRS